MLRHIRTYQRDLLVLSVLLLASVAACTFIVARRLYLGEWQFYFLIWNLFLAWIPLGIAAILRLMRRPPWPILLAGGLVWMAFLPNSPYILTDLIHFRWSRTMVWFDWSMFLTFALTGLFVGYASLVWMQAIVRERWGRGAGNVLTMVALVGCGAGVYIGRFLRWNSWDIVTRPEQLLLNIYGQFFSPDTFFHTWGLTVTFALLFGFCYVMVQLLAEPVESRATEQHYIVASGD